MYIEDANLIEGESVTGESTAEDGLSKAGNTNDEITAQDLGISTANLPNTIGEGEDNRIDPEASDLALRSDRDFANLVVAAMRVCGNSDRFQSHQSDPDWRIDARKTGNWMLGDGLKAFCDITNLPPSAVSPFLQAIANHKPKQPPADEKDDNLANDESA
jgi:hypothetical protein